MRSWLRLSFVRDSNKVAKSVGMAQTAVEKDSASQNGGKNSPGVTFAHQDRLPKLPIPELEHTVKKYLEVLEPLQNKRDPQIFSRRSDMRHQTQIRKDQA